MAGFDVAKARADGHSDEEILNYLATTRPKFDLAKARADGHSTGDLITYLSQAPPSTSAAQPVAPAGPVHGMEQLGGTPPGPAKPPAPRPDIATRTWNAFRDFSPPSAAGDWPELGPQFRQQVSDFAQGVKDMPQKTWESFKQGGRAMVNLDIPNTFWHTAGGVPTLGPQTQQMARDVYAGDWPEFVGHGAGATVPLWGPKAFKAGGDTALTAAKVSGGAVKGGWEAGTEVVPLKVTHIENRIPVPKVLAAGVGGATTARIMGADPWLGAGLGAAAPVVYGMYKGARRSLGKLPKPPVPTNSFELAKSQFNLPEPPEVYRPAGTGEAMEPNFVDLPPERMGQAPPAAPPPRPPDPVIAERVGTKRVGGFGSGRPGRQDITPTTTLNPEEIPPELIEPRPVQPAAVPVKPPETLDTKRVGGFGSSRKPPQNVTPTTILNPEEIPPELLEPQPVQPPAPTLEQWLAAQAESFPTKRVGGFGASAVPSSPVTPVVKIPPPDLGLGVTPNPVIEMAPLPEGGVQLPSGRSVLNAKPPGGAKATVPPAAPAVVPAPVDVPGSVLENARAVGRGLTAEQLAALAKGELKFGPGAKPGDMNSPIITPAPETPIAPVAETPVVTAPETPAAPIGVTSINGIPAKGPAPEGLPAEPLPMSPEELATRNARAAEPEPDMAGWMPKAGLEATHTDTHLNAQSHIVLREIKKATGIDYGKHMSPISQEVYGQPWQLLAPPLKANINNFMHQFKRPPNWEDVLNGTFNRYRRPEGWQ